MFLSFNSASQYRGRLLIIIVSNIAGTIKYTVGTDTYTITVNADTTYSYWHSINTGDTVTLVSATTNSIKTINAILLY